jgi:sugar lactone lactonase YvrE
LNNGSYKPEFAITKGLANPQGLWLDSQSNLYVANYFLEKKKYSDVISEYAKGAKKPKCTYDTGSDAIVDVTTDSKGNVYTADDSSIAPGISEFAQCGNAIQLFKTPHPATGLAFDSHGNLLVALVLPHYKSAFVEVLKGSSKATPLKLETGVTDGIALDAQDNLVVPDVANGVIHVSAPPYETSTTFAKGVTGAAFAALNHDESLLFCSGYGYVWVFDYPSGTYVTKITGFGDPKGVADAPPPP